MNMMPVISSDELRNNNITLQFYPSVISDDEKKYLKPGKEDCSYFGVKSRFNDIERVYNFLYNRAEPIDDNHRRFYLGEFPLIDLDAENNKYFYVGLLLLGARRPRKS